MAATSYVIKAGKSRSNEMVFRPAGNDHAIVSTTFTVTLDNGVPREIVSALRTKNSWATTLPAIRDIQGIELQVQPNGVAQVKQSPGLEFAFLLPNGSSTWALRVDSTDVVVECSLYTRWAQVWQQARKLLAQALVSVEAAKPSIKSFTMQVLDRFESDDANDLAGELFDASWLDTRLQSVSGLWHKHCGWLEPSQLGEVLQNINIDVLPRQQYGTSNTKMVNILHLQRLHFSSPIAVTDDAAALETAFEPLAANMHAANKSLLRESLVQPQKDAIQLDGTNG